MGFTCGVSAGYITCPMVLLLQKSESYLVRYTNDRDNPVKIKSVTLKLGTGAGEFTAGDYAKGFGHPYTITLSIGSSSATQTVSKISASKWSESNQYFYTDTSALQSYKFEFSSPIQVGVGNTVNFSITFDPDSAEDNSRVLNWDKNDITGEVEEVPSTYTATFNSNGGSTANPSTITKDIGQSLGTLPTTSREGYTFGGWYTTATGGSLVTSSTKPTGDVTYYAHWTAKTYEIYYHANGGWNAPDPQYQTHGKTIYLSDQIPIQEGYTFVGWGISATSTTPAYSPGAPYGANSDIELYAIWEINKYTIKYDANGGTGAPSSQTKTHGQTLTLSSTEPTRSGYTFLGWGGTDDADTPSYSPGSPYGVNADITLYAVWEGDTYKVTYNANGGTGAPSAQNKTHGVTLKLSTTKPSKSFTLKYSGTDCDILPSDQSENCTFKNWNTKANGSGTSYASGANYTSNADVTLYAQWTNPTAVISSVIPSSEGRKFLGWAVGSDTSNLYNPGSTITISGNTTLVAVFSELEYTLEFDANGGKFADNTTIKRVTVKYGENATPPSPDPTRSGKTFKGWFGSYTNVTNNNKVKAMWGSCPIWVMTQDSDGNKHWVPLGV